MINNLIENGWLKSPEIISAFKKISRVDFLEGKNKESAELNEALPIGYGQTISQPLTVAFMLELLQAEKGDRILDVGFGSGWTSALLAEIAGIRGKVIALELVPELAEMGKNNIARYSFIEKGIVETVCADGSKGWVKESPYDKILCSASAQDSIPEEWKEQLKVGGRIVAPVGSSIWLYVKKKKEKGDEPSAHLHSSFEEKEYPGFIFVPLVSK